jgi:hypothetical protein
LVWFPFPSSQYWPFRHCPPVFFGTVKDKGANVPNGTLVKASINEQVYAEAKTLTYQGDSVYSLDVPGDHSSTTMVEGGMMAILSFST